jgi:hypothetical protein
MGQRARRTGLWGVRAHGRSALRFDRAGEPLLAAEMGNCLEAGWFESLVLAHFADRGNPAVQRRLLERIHAARIGFRAVDGKAAPDQLAALRRELARLEATYIPLMGYWGIDV